MAFVALNEDMIETLRTERSQEEFYDSEFKLDGSFGLRVSKSARKVFFVIYSINGKRKRMTLGAYPVLALSEARKRALEIVRSVAEGRDPASERRQYRTAETFSQLVELFLERHVEQTCKESTKREYRRILQGELVPAWGDRRVGDISAGDVHLLLEEIAVGRGSVVMANRVRALAGKLFAYAVNCQLLEKNPVVTTATPGRELPAQRILGFDEIKLLWQVLEGEDVIVAGIFKLLVLTGQRPADVMSMRWSDVTLETWTLSARTTKDSDVFRVYLPPQAMQVLRQVREAESSSEYVFPSRSGRTVRGGRPVRSGSHVSYIRKTARRLCQQMGVEQVWSPRDIRRTVALRLGELGVRPDLVERILARNVYYLRRGLSEEGGVGSFDYFDEIKHALTQWNRKVASVVDVGPRPEPGDKVVKLFG